MAQRTLTNPAELPEGFLYQPNFLTETEESDLLRRIQKLEFGVYDFRGYIAKRRVLAFGGGYDFSTRRMTVASEAIPDFLISIRDRAAAVAGMTADEIGHAMITEYSIGAPIGWHRDAPQFEAIIGISLRSSCRMRFKPHQDEGKIVSILLEPRSIYVMRGVARSRFQHSIPAVKDLRYSITFRTLRQKRRAA